MKNKILYLIIGILLVLLIVVLVKNKSTYISNTETGDSDISFKALETPVEIDVISKQSLIRTIHSNGIIKAAHFTRIFPQVSGIIRDLRFHEGDFVKQDDVILKIDDTIYKIEYDKTKEQFNKALAEYGIMILGENGNIMQMTSDTSFNENQINQDNINDRDAFELLKGNQRKAMLANKAGLTLARLNLQKAEIDLKNTIITASFDGYVAEMDLCKDMRIQTGDDILTIVALDTLLIEVGILETEIHYVKQGAHVSIELAAFPGKTYSGIVKTKSPILDSESGTCRVHIELINDNAKEIKPGMFANVSIQAKEFKNKLVIPRKALLIRDDRKLTFVYEKGKAKWRYVKTGLENNDFIEITEGLAGGDSLITSGQFHLAHDAAVEIVNGGRSSVNGER